MEVNSNLIPIRNGTASSLTSLGLLGKAAWLPIHRVQAAEFVTGRARVIVAVIVL
jgi:hypothetical protein